eukprot:CAMPEP_0195059680 /NCGR_PEP_ID=MMETSP0448-20130528/7117_1 /TAXON_ID=66468 /ORGANISM="Heterocapsa triquestra, Strain CCMP 448" /LENGTH=76 /DNA_ID=CAMNT_0040089997 /DNA_START=220 /DNA_END=447 /DNA_ORIENTATION=-
MGMADPPSSGGCAWLCTSKWQAAANIALTTPSGSVCWAHSRTAPSATPRSPWCGSSCQGSMALASGPGNEMQWESK